MKYKYLVKKHIDYEAFVEVESDELLDEEKVVAFAALIEDDDCWEPDHYYEPESIEVVNRDELARRPWQGPPNYHTVQYDQSVVDEMAEEE